VPEEQDQRQKPSSKENIATEAISPHQSYWPFALAVAIIVLIVGVVTHPIVMGIGVVLVAASIIGWGLERH